MKKRADTKFLGTSISAGASALAALALGAPAHAGDATVAELTQPSSTVEVGVGDVTSSSFKFGEYNGLQDRGLFGIGNFDLRGGGRYDSNDATRWAIRGHDLGLDTRGASVDYGKQGTFRFDFGYDELRKNYSDTYQTPYRGLGSDNFFLPSNWIKPIVPQVSGTALNYRSLSTLEGTASAVTSAGLVKPPTAGQLATLTHIFDTDRPDFTNVDLSTKRHAFNSSFAYSLDPQWELHANWRRDHKDGLRAQGAIDDALNGNSAVILPTFVDETTDQYDFGVNFAGQRGFGQLMYYGSIYENNVNSITWADPNNPATSGRMSTAPSNQFHQFAFTGGYSLMPSTQLVVAGKYGRNTQNEAFLNDPQLPLGLPRPSANGLVVTKSFSLKLSTRPINRLNVTAGAKFDDRDNRTPVDLYVFQDVNEAPSAAGSPFNAALGLAPNTLRNNINLFDSRQHSRKDFKADLAADFALTRDNSLDAGYAFQRTLRHCGGTWINCENADDMKEHTLHAEWRSRITDELNSRIEYSWSKRTVNYNIDAWLALVPMANVIPGAPVTGATTSVYGYLQQTGLSGWGPFAPFPSTPLTGNAAIFSAGNNIVSQSLYGSRDNLADLPGLRRFNDADRDRNKVQGSLNWEATERLSLQVGGDFNRDNYPDSVYGVQRSSSWDVNFDANLLVTEDLTTSFFYSHENLSSRNTSDGFGTNSNAAFVGRAGNTLVSGGCYSTVLQKNLNGKIDQCLNWAANHVEEADTLGLALRDANLMSGRLDVAANVAVSWARTHVGVDGGTYNNNPFALAGAPVLAAGVPAVFFIPAGDMPEAAYRSVELHMDGLYHLAKSSAVHLGYAFKHLGSRDYAYDGTQFGTMTTVMPTGEQAPHYTVHVFGASYIYTFR